MVGGATLLLGAGAVEAETAVPLKCVSCHGSIRKGAHRHAPVIAGECTACHIPSGNRHPGGQGKGFRLAEGGERLCGPCHASKLEGRSVHRPVADGKCLACHLPHTSAEPSLLRRPGPELCRSCHAGLLTRDQVHRPVADGNCLACHDPHRSDHPKLLRQEASVLCTNCHGNKAMKNTVHRPVRVGDCLACHEHHQASHDRLLRVDKRELCYRCHQREIFADARQHAPVAAGTCTVCHDPHQSDTEHLLLKGGAVLCLTCHASSLTAGASVHEPVANGECGACHAPHAAPHRRLLVRNYSESFYLPYSTAHFALCFGCHPADLALDVRTVTLTGFRNGDGNLHFVHVAKNDVGRSCKVCHDPHAARQERLIKERVPGFGRWEIPISFTRTSTGGSCVAGCHKPKAYDRLSPAENP